MHDIRWIRENPDAFDRALAYRKNVPVSASGLIALDDARRTAIRAVEQAQEKRNAVSKAIGQAKAQKDETRAEALMAEVAAVKEQLPALEATRREADAALRQALLELPNLPAPGVPVGEGEAENAEYFGPNGSPQQAAKLRPAKPEFTFRPKEHFETGEALGEMDFEVAAKLSGSRFVVLKSHLARLERAIGQFMLDLHIDEHGYTEVQPPLLVRDDALYGTNQLPKFAEDLFRIHDLRDDVSTRIDVLAALQEQVRTAARTGKLFLDELRVRNGLTADVKDLFGQTVAAEVDALQVSVSRQIERIGERLSEHPQQSLWLIPTAEVPLTNLVRESILTEDELPLRFTALTPCFRSEAGSAGRDTRGMLRQHQFNKVEMVAITTPDASADEHEKMLADAEDVMRKLGLHYRVMQLSTGDMGFGAQRTYDIEVWLPGQDAYREISSISLCGEFQARRMEAQYRPGGWEKGKGGLPYVHTLNGSGVAVGRALIAVMENYQQEDGSIAIPDVLQPYMKGLKAIGARS